jgi:MraZ protein
MFLGRFVHTIDAKGRVSIPAGFRMELQRRSQLAPVVTIQLECLALYAHEDWVSFANRLTEVDPLRLEGRALQRFWISNCVACPLDAQGRILIPEFLRDHAKLDKEVVIAGLGNCIEIWDRRLYDEEQARTLARLPEISQEISKSGSRE